MSWDASLQSRSAQHIGRCIVTAGSRNRGRISLWSLGHIQSPFWDEKGRDLPRSLHLPRSLPHSLPPLSPPSLSLSPSPSRYLCLSQRNFWTRHALGSGDACWPLPNNKDRTTNCAPNVLATLIPAQPEPFNTSERKSSEEYIKHQLSASKPACGSPFFTKLRNSRPYVNRSSRSRKPCTEAPT